MTEQPWNQVLRCATPESWLDAAEADLELLLVDHAHCERKAASSALSLMYRYADLIDIQQHMSRLAREELRHFEQVLGLLAARGWSFRKLNPSGYAAGLHAQVRRDEPGRLVDTLIVGALIEARSCERFAALAPRLGQDLGRYYHRLCGAEARHFEQYLGLAAAHCGDGADLDSRIAMFSAQEAALIQQPDSRFRFHSGVPLPAAAGPCRHRASLVTAESP